jgi:prevent-host-death family protein
MGKPMTISTVSSREFNQDTAKAKRAARHGPVIITDRGRPAHVLLSIEQYEALNGPSSSIVELLAMETADRVRFTAPRVRKLTRPAELD